MTVATITMVTKDATKVTMTGDRLLSCEMNLRDRRVSLVVFVVVSA